MTDELKKCPFCGSEDIVLLEGIKIQGVEVCFVNCNFCHSRGTICLAENKEEAVSAWNRRANND